MGALPESACGSALSCRRDGGNSDEHSKAWPVFSADTLSNYDRTGRKVKC